MAALCHRLLQFDHCVLELTEEALTFCPAHGDRHREAALENNLADLHHVAGRSVESMDHLKRAVAIFSEVGAGGHVAERPGSSPAFLEQVAGLLAGEVL